MKNKFSLKLIGDWKIKITALWLVFVFCLLIANLFLNNSPLGLNGVGDYLAGMLTPVALLWLILGYLQQGSELKNSNAQLSLQTDELRNSVETQTKQNSNSEKLLAVTNRTVFFEMFESRLNDLHALALEFIFHANKINLGFEPIEVKREILFSRLSTVIQKKQQNLDYYSVRSLTHHVDLPTRESLLSIVDRYTQHFNKLCSFARECEGIESLNKKQAATKGELSNLCKYSMAGKLNDEFEKLLKDA